MEIKGKINTAICYATIIEDSAVEQIQRMCDYPFTEGSKIRIMPDVHAGKGCTVGTTMTVTDKAVPNIVGVDIGCGMFTVNIGSEKIDFEKFDEAAHFIPSGFKVWEGRHTHFDLLRLRCYRELKDSRRIERSLGTLGGGNHFIEIDRANDGTNFLVIHSGSRNLGKQVAEIYQQLAIELNQGKEEYLNKREEIIRTYKEQGRRKEIQAVLKKLQWTRKESTMPMAEIILSRVRISAGVSFHTTHNYIDTKEMILRKGAIAAHTGEKVLIPVNMRDGSILATGKGNPEWNFSAPHGAGRLMSRNVAKENLSLTDYEKSMQGIYTTSVNESTLDEAPMAYKSLDDILKAISDTVDIIEVLKPIYNFKASFGDEKITE